jgi:hypothetical protein
LDELAPDNRILRCSCRPSWDLRGARSDVRVTLFTPERGSESTSDPTRPYPRGPRSLPHLNTITSSTLDAAPLQRTQASRPLVSESKELLPRVPLLSPTHSKP